jgi:phosphatidylserine decarboxylase
MAKPLPLPIWDRQRRKLVEEGVDEPSATYESQPHRSISQWAKSLPLYDWLIAAYENTRWSAREIEPFAREHCIDMTEFEPDAYRSFAEFFDPTDPPEMGAFAEARYLAWERLDAGQHFPVKGARLSPVDSHLVHYSDDGRTLQHYRLGGRLWTVNWHALPNQEDILFRNERQVSILQTDHFGHLAFVEIGALSVGRIDQVHPVNLPFRRGEEKSAFNSADSAIAVFGVPGRWQPSADLVERTNVGVETFVRLGETIGHAQRPEDVGHGGSHGKS